MATSVPGIYVLGTDGWAHIVFYPSGQWIGR